MTPSYNNNPFKDATYNSYNYNVDIYDAYLNYSGTDTISFKRQYTLSSTNLGNSCVSVLYGFLAKLNINDGYDVAPAVSSSYTTTSLYSMFSDCSANLSPSLERCTYGTRGDFSTTMTTTDYGTVASKYSKMYRVTSSFNTYSTKTYTVSSNYSVTTTSQ